MRFLAILLVATLCCCKAANTTSRQQVTLEQIVATEIGAGATIEKNDSQTFVLAFKVNGRQVEFVVVRLSDLKIVIKEKIQGSVTWSRQMDIKVTQTPGMVRKDSDPRDNVRIIDLNNYSVHKR